MYQDIRKSAPVSLSFGYFLSSRSSAGNTFAIGKEQQHISHRKAMANTVEIERAYSTPLAA
jgi:hypothetical protein